MANEENQPSSYSMPPLLPSPAPASGSIGAASPELAKFLIDDELAIKAIVEKLSGIYVRYEVKDGQVVEKIKYEKDRAYPQAAIDWFERKIRALMNKGMYLSQFSKDDFLEAARTVAFAFDEELYDFSDELELRPEQMIELHNIYVTALMFGIRRAVGESTAKLISHTSGESIVRTSNEDKRPVSLKRMIFG